MGKWDGIEEERQHVPEKLIAKRLPKMNQGRPIDLKKLDGGKNQGALWASLSKRGMRIPNSSTDGKYKKISN